MKSLKKSQAILFWCTSYLLLLVLFITNIAIVFSLNRAVANRMNDKYCNILLGGISENAQEAVEKSGDIYSRVVNFSNLRSIMEIRRLEDYYRSAEVSALLDRLLVFADDNINFYIYLPETDTIISPGGIYSTQMYYGSFMQQYGATYEEWMHTHSELDSTDSLAEGELEQIVFREEYTDSAGKQIILVTMYDEAFLLDIDDLPEWVAECDIYLSDLKGDIFIRRQNSDITEKPEAADAIKGVYNDEWELFVKRLDASIPCNITIAYPRGAAWAELEGLKNLELSLSIVLIIVCVMVIIWAIRRNYNPISSILKVLDIPGSRREYDDIEKSVTELLSQNKLYSKKLRQLDNVNVQMTLSRCLSRNYSPQDIDRVLAENNIKFEYEYFAVCAFDIYDIGELFGNLQTQITNEEKFRDLTFIMNNIFSELFANRSCRCDLVTVLDNIFIIINTDDGKCFESGTVNETVKYGLDFIVEHFHIRLSYVVSELYCGAENLHKAYNQCMYLLRYKEAMGIEKPLSIGDIQKNSQISINAFLNSDTEQKLINCIASGNAEGAKLLINRIFADISEKDLTLEQLQCILISLGCILCKVPQSEINIDYEKILLHSKSSVQMQQFLIETSGKICENFKPVIIPKANMMAEVTAYIEENYSSVINLSMIADRFEMSSNYLSVNFKQSTGISIPDYINKVRLDKAKELLRDSSLTIKEIAVETGFGNMRTFNRIYQKYEGITPSAYRNSAL